MPAITTTATGATTIGAVPLPIASRTQTRMAANYGGVSNLTGATSFPITQIAASGWVRAICLNFTATYATSASGAIVTGDSPWNLISSLSLTDSQGTPIIQPISGYGLYLKNKYLDKAFIHTNTARYSINPHMGPDYAFSSTATDGTAFFRLWLIFEEDEISGYGCIPNLDSNASLQLKVDIAPSSVAFTGGTATAATLAMRVTQYYYAPIAGTFDGAAVNASPLGAGDYMETRYDTQTVSASTENRVALSHKGGMIGGIILVSRAAGVRTAYTAASNVGLSLDNVPVHEAVPFPEWQDMMRRMHGYLGADITTTYAPLTAGVLPGLDRGVLVYPFQSLAGQRQSWLPTRVGSLLEAIFTPGAASSLEIYTKIGQIRDKTAFYDSATY